MSNTTAIANKLRALCLSQKLAVLCTHNQGTPYGSLVAFAYTQDLRRLIFATQRHTRKYANLTAEPRVALLIDNRKNRATDFRRAAAATAVGRIREIPKTKTSPLLRLYLTRHPQLRDFVQAPDCALMGITVAKYQFVSQFQQVCLYDPRKDSAINQAIR